MREKLTKIILPFIFISTGFLLTYSSFYWLFFIRLKLVDLNDNIFGFFVPISISAILIWFYFRKKLRLLETTDKHKEFTLFISWVLLTAPVLTFQFYLERETGELTQLNNVEEILTNKPTMYYSIKNSTQHKNKSGLYVTKASVDRGNEIGVGCYFACPLTNTEDTTYSKSIWIGTMFGKKFSNRVFDDKEKQAKQISKFIDSSITLYNNYRYRTIFLKRLSNSDERDDYMKSIKQADIPYNKENLIILKEETENYQLRTGTSLWWTIFTFITSNITWTLLTIFTKLKHSGKKNTL
ncbi:hypothetical protein D3C87_904170 [compost metagenome]